MMTYSNARYVDVDEGEIDVDRNGETIRIKPRPGLVHFDALMAAGLTIAPSSQWRKEICARVDADAGRVRARYMTLDAGMELTYAEKQRQAIAVHAMGQENANALTEAQRVEMVPTLAASVGLEAATLWDCAQLVIAKAEAMADLSYVIERARLTAKKAISEAADAAAARAAYEAIQWPT